MKKCLYFIIVCYFSFLPVFKITGTTIFDDLKAIESRRIMCIDIVGNDPSDSDLFYLGINIPRQAIEFNNLFLFGGGKASFDGFKREVIWGSEYKINQSMSVGLTGYKVIGGNQGFIGPSFTYRW